MARRRWLRSRHWLGVLVFLMGAGFSVGSYSFLRQREQLDARARFESRVRDATATLEGHLRLPLEIALMTPDFLTARPEASQGEFASFTAPAINRHHALTALEWAPRVRAEARAAFERDAFSVWQPGEDASHAPVTPRSDYYPLLYIVPPAPELLGLDIAFEPERRAMVDLAVRTGRAAASSRFRLVEDPPGVSAVAVYAPVFAGAPASGAERLANVRGIAVALFRLQTVLEAALKTSDLTDLSFSLLDVTEPSRAQLLASSETLSLSATRSARSPNPSEEASREQAAGDPTVVASTERATSQPLHWRREFPFLNRRWQIVWTGAPALLEPSRPTHWILIAGLVLSACLAALFSIGLFALRRQKSVVRVGSFTLGRQLGQGGMGTVFEAEHALLRRRTAVKLIRPELASDSTLERFEREVQATSRLTHPNTVQIFDFGSTAEGVFFYAMEYLDGMNLAETLRSSGPLPPERCVFLMRQVASSIREAHRLGMVHRDLKPENIMICERGGLYDFVKVLDFGLVKQPLAGGAKLTQEHSLVGTPDYMAPELLEDARAVTPRSDVYGLGCLLYFMLTGSPPHTAPSLMALVARVMTSEPPPLATARGSEVPSELARLTMRCLARSPAERPADAGVLLDELELVASTLAPWSQLQAKTAWDTRPRLVPRATNQTLTLTGDGEDRAG